MKIEDFSEYEDWVRNLFNGDGLVYAVAYQIFEAARDQRLTGLGVIIEKEREPIQDSEVANLALFLTEKGLTFNRKRNMM